MKVRDDADAVFAELSAELVRREAPLRELLVAPDAAADFFAELRATWDREAAELRADLVRREAPLRELLAARDDFFAELRATWEREAAELSAELMCREAPLRELLAATVAASRLDPPPPIEWPVVDPIELAAWRDSSGPSLRRSCP